MLGVHFAITAEQEKLLLDADGDDDAVSEILGDLEEEWPDDDLKVDTDKAWDAIHRCLTDGTLDPDAGDPPLSLAVAGGRHLHDEMYVVHVTAAEVREVAAALLDIDEAWLRERFGDFGDDYDGAADEQDFQYTWSNLADLRDFYQRAAAAGRAVIFTAT
ncbi:hypothetical protein Aph02nite_29930 [Actinoplanes philippinensis]|uniref:DUF1877 family protein n=1 Tax=Actinoplanes philippinensis TaxID=35752 RepID=A0A1I2EEY8_9ACTN|nr:DUF1877 family protein [Actinoplanes philippinensis]GIE77043.1 hypothetical protein Aph02nite_29930 [Actinoplanes philippinensis]SFE91415.1 protein of unknown function [Actinoplanes philippinensis]